MTTKTGDQFLLGGVLLVVAQIYESDLGPRVVLSHQGVEIRRFTVEQLNNEIQGGAITRLSQ